jgi:hypothetical protein
MGGVAGFAGGALDDILMRRPISSWCADTMWRWRCGPSCRWFDPGQVFALLAAIFAVSERRLSRAASARSFGPSAAWLRRQPSPRRQRRAPLDPASTAGVARIHRCQMTLVPAFIIAKRRSRHVGLGFRIRLPAGHDASRRLEQYARLRRFSVAPQPGGGDVPGRPGINLAPRTASERFAMSVKLHLESFRHSSPIPAF